MKPTHTLSRRDLFAGAAATTATFMLPKFAFTQGNDQIKVGVVGCGGRGTGAAMDAAAADPGVVIWSMGDAFEDRLRGSRGALKDALKDRYHVTDDRAFHGFDAYKSVIASGADVVILATPPGFRPEHFREAIDSGKHVFMEKPVATDAPGIRTVIESATIAQQKGLSVVAGTQRRHDVAYVQCMEKIHDGAIGEVVASYCYWNQGGLWAVPRKNEFSDMEWQVRNWLYFTWLSGDHIVEQHIHNIDVCNWAMQGVPVKAVGMGGRQVRTDPVYGHIFDHFAIEFEYEGGAKMISFCRQIDNTASRVSEHIVGTKGKSNANTSIKGETTWRFDGERPNPYVDEHKHLFQAIRGGKPVNEARRVAESTLCAIMGRMTAYTGQEVTWDQAYDSMERLVPDVLEFGPMSVPSVAQPGTTKLI